MISLPPVRPRRKIDGVSAVLLPFRPDGAPDLDAWAGLVEGAWASGLTPAVNMDTGYANLLPASTRAALLEETGRMARGRRFVAGAFVEGEPGDPAALYRRECVAIHRAGGTPILFPCSATAGHDAAGLVGLYREVGRAVPEFLGFELGKMFVPFGRIWEADVFRALLDVPQMTGAKHSSLDRVTEWERLAIRDAARPGFRLYTGNDLAIDMVMWGSDYLLGLSAFHPAAFAARDRAWAAGHAAFYEINDWLQYLGMFAFRDPVPAYRHACAQFLALRGVIPCDAPHPAGARRPDADREVLAPIARRLDALAARVA